MRKLRKSVALESKKNLAQIVNMLSSSLYLKLSYFHSRGKFPNLKNPKNISEIILSQIISGEINTLADYVDKLKVRDYFLEWGLGDYLPKLYGIWDNVDDINFDLLPSSFALKTNHGCGSHYLCKDKNNLDIITAKQVISKALLTKFGLTETQYHYIVPRVYCEEFIDDGQAELPLDYKFLCCDGEVKAILLVSERATETRLSTYDLEWNKLDFVRDFEKSFQEFKKPKNLDIMIKIAQQIAKKFVFVRVDLYDNGDKVFIGELTFTPQGGIMSYFTNKGVDFMGRK